MIEIPDELRRKYQNGRARTWENDVTKDYGPFSIQMTLAMTLHAEWELIRFTDKAKHETRSMWAWQEWMMEADRMLMVPVPE